MVEAFCSTQLGLVDTLRAVREWRASEQHPLKGQGVRLARLLHTISCAPDDFPGYTRADDIQTSRWVYRHRLYGISEEPDVSGYIDNINPKLDLTKFVFVVDLDGSLG